MDVKNLPASKLGKNYQASTTGEQVGEDGRCRFMVATRSGRNEAFAKVDAATLDSLAADPTGALADVLKLHVVSGKIMAADGTVVAMCNDLPEQVPGALPKDLPIGEADGNFVVLDIGRGNHVLYAHMQPGSVTVAAGAKVKRGDRLGKVGNTGNTQAPHLHLHVMGGPRPWVKG